MKLFDNLFKINSSNYYGVTGLNSELSYIYIYNTLLQKKRSILVIVNSLYEANMLYQGLANYTSRVLFFPMDDFITSEAIAISPEFKTERINTINKLISEDGFIVVTNLMGVLRYLPAKRVWEQSIVKLKVHEEINRDELINKLYNLGYEKETIVTETGKMGIRGYVIDIFPIGEKHPVRVEFWGDEIDSIKYFSEESQLSLDDISEIIINPFSEFLLDNYQEDIQNRQKYLKYYAKEVAGIWDYLNDGICFYCDYSQLVSAYMLLRETIMEYDVANPSSIKTDYMFDIHDIKCYDEVFMMNVDNVLPQVKLKAKEEYVSFNVDDYNGDYGLVKKDLVKFLEQGKTVVGCFSSMNVIKRVMSYLDMDEIIVTNEEEILPKRINFIVKSIQKGFMLDNLVVLAENDLFGHKSIKPTYKSSYRQGTKIENVSNLVRGDYIVHENYGIGIYDELCTITKNGYKKDYIKLIYASGDVLYVPVEKIDRISKFSGKEGVTPKINKLGSDDWQKKKARVKKRLVDIAGNLLRVSAEREAKQGFAFSSDDEQQVLFDSEFEYQETADQLKAISIIKTEMERNKPMDMLLCGDVGYGKTEVAFRAMFKAVNDGKQVAYLCPTTILSNQQYENAIKRFENFPVRIALLNRFVEKRKQIEILDDLKNGKVDILFGTHRILSKDVEFKDLGLLVVDEEQRFGVTHKERIKEYKANVDVLTLSATPIPRTLQMSMSGVRSLALIETAPAQRLPVQTYVLPENTSVIKDAIYKELSRNGQVFILFNNVAEIEDKVTEIHELVPEAKIDYAHGRMTKAELERKMMEFVSYKFDVLICTTIIETGIDIPNVNTLIIYNADRFGLAQLYQIRGRIGRSSRIGYAYLMYDNRKVLNDIAIKRLNTIKEFTELGSGFKIAMRDLSIRGAGDILGSEQSGFIDTIGIDLYLKMLRETVAQMKGEKVEEEENTKDTKPIVEIATHISDSYIADTDLKIEIHKKINTIDSLEKLLEIKSELEDRFGKISYDMEIYMYEEWLEKLASDMGIINSKQTKDFVELEVPSNISSGIDGEKLFMMAYDISHNFRLSYRDNKIFIRLDFAKLDKHFLLYLIDLLQRMKEELIDKI